jgi:Synergist-CTERM protein sorting domain-containing protein
VTFRSISLWDRPADIPVSVDSKTVTTRTGTYVPIQVIPVSVDNKSSDVTSFDVVSVDVTKASGDLKPVTSADISGDITVKSPDVAPKSSDMEPLSSDQEPVKILKSFAFTVSINPSAKSGDFALPILVTLDIASGDLSTSAWAKISNDIAPSHDTKTLLSLIQVFKALPAKTVNLIEVVRNAGKNLDDFFAWTADRNKITITMNLIVVDSDTASVTPVAVSGGTSFFLVYDGKANGSIYDPISLWEMGEKAAPTTAPTTAPTKTPGGSSGGGCNAGFGGLMILMAAVIPAVTLRRKKSR